MGLISLYKNFVMSVAEIALLLNLADSDSVELFIFFILSSVSVVAFGVLFFIGCLCCCPGEQSTETRNRRRRNATQNNKEHIV